MNERIPLFHFVVILGTFLCAVIIVVTNLTAPRIARNHELRIKRNVLDAQGIAYQSETLEDMFEKNIGIVEKGGKTFYVTTDKDIAFEFSGPAFYGPIEGVIALSKDLVTIKKVMIARQEETPGLGGRVAERAYLDRFENKRLLPKLEILNRRKAEKNNEVDGITGATMTSKAFEGLLNKQTEEYIKAYRGAAE